MVGWCATVSAAALFDADWLGATKAGMRIASGIASILEGWLTSVLKSFTSRVFNGGSLSENS